jgi:hypothetical protein
MVMGKGKAESSIDSIHICTLYLLLRVFLIGYGAVAGFNVGDEKPPHYYLLSYTHTTYIEYRVSKKRTVAVESRQPHIVKQRSGFVMCTTGNIIL